MRDIHLITEKNFADSFNLTDILQGSAFYPVSGMDAGDIERLTGICNSFVHVDYSCSREELENALRKDFQRAGYRIVGLLDLSVRELAPMDSAGRIYSHQ